MNTVILIGNIGNEPQIKQFDNGNKVANFPLATNESYKDKQGNKVEAAEWHNIVAYGKVVEVVEKYFKKGTKISITGKLKTRSWEQDGQKKYITEIILNQFEFVGSANTQSQDNHEPKVVNNQFSNEQKDDDLPF